MLHSRLCVLRAHGVHWCTSKLSRCSTTTAVGHRFRPRTRPRQRSTTRYSMTTPTAASRMRSRPAALEPWTYAFPDELRECWRLRWRSAQPSDVTADDSAGGDFLQWLPCGPAGGASHRPPDAGSSSRCGVCRSGSTGSSRIGLFVCAHFEEPSAQSYLRACCRPDGCDGSANGARSSSSIFMASRTPSTSPSFTCWPAVTRTSSTVPGMGASTDPSPVGASWGRARVGSLEDVAVTVDHDLDLVGCDGRRYRHLGSVSGEHDRLVELDHDRRCWAAGAEPVGAERAIGDPLRKVQRPAGIRRLALQAGRARLRRRHGRPRLVRRVGADRGAADRATASSTATGWSRTTSR